MKSSQLLPLLFLLCTLVFHVYCADKKIESLLNVNGWIICIADFNGDLISDFMVLEGKNNLFTYLCKSNTNNALTSSMSCEKSQESSIGSLLPSDSIVHSVTPLDFNYNGILDVCVTFKLSSSATDFTVWIFQGSPDYKFDVTNILKLDGSFSSPPIVYDYGKNLHSSLLLLPTSASIPVNAVFNSDTKKIDNNPFSGFTCSSSSLTGAYYDIDGDCKPDLLLRCGNTLTVLKNDNSPNYVSASSTVDLPANSGPLSYGDFDADAAMDIVFPVCSSAGSGCSIHVIFNAQRSYCSGPGSAGDCKNVITASDICQADTKFGYGGGASEAHVSMTVEELFKNGDEKAFSNILISENTLDDKTEMPIAFAVGDFNLDGYPDLVVTVSGTKDDPSTSAVAYLKNVECGSDLAPTKCLGNGRTFVFQKLFIKGGKHSAFVDILNVGILNLWVNYVNSNNERQLMAVSNWLDIDNLFMKSQVTNGADSKNYGVAYPGACVKFQVRDERDYSRVRVSNNLVTSGFYSLASPAYVIGLGRPTNFLEFLTAGVGRNQGHTFSSTNGIIPNSFLIMTPNQSPEKDWKIELIINAAKYRAFVWISVILAAFILIVVVTALHVLEKREDLREKKRIRHVINFDAL